MAKFVFKVEDLDRQATHFVKVVNPHLKASETQWDSFIEFNFPKEIVIVKVSVRGNRSKYITFIHPESTISQQVAVPNTFKVKIINKEKDLKKLKECYNKYLILNLHKQLAHSFTIGSDPEIFVGDKKGNVIPAFDFLGSKDKPNRVGSTECKTYWDGFQAEFTTSVGTCLAYQVDSVKDGLTSVFKYAKEHNKDAQLLAKTVVDIPQEALESGKEEHVQFGCMPSLNIYGMKGETAHGRDVPFRPAGGHIHFGCGTLTKKAQEDVVKALDAIVGVACVSLFAKFDDPKRRQLYGLAGEYRLPKHGLEYRVLSNAWLFHPMIMNLVFDLARKAFMFGRNGFSHLWDATEKETIETINNCDVEQARKILNRNKRVFKQLLKAAYNFGDEGLNTLFNVFINGMESVVKDPSDFEKNWNLIDGAWIYHSDGKNKNVARSLDNLKLERKVA